MWSSVTRVRAGIYARISDDREQTQAGVGRQIEDCEARARDLTWQIVDRYVDNDISAYRDRIRPEYKRLLADIAAGRINAVIVYHEDRLHRQPRELEEFFDVCDRAGVSALASCTGELDLSTDDGRLVARIKGAVARKSSDDMSRRIARKHLEMARAGKPGGGGARPFGFEADRITLRGDEADVIREMADRLLAGETLRGLCVDLNERGIRTSTGGEWTPFPLKRLLASARISGQREHRGEIVADAVWPAIIPPEQTTRIRALLADPSRRAARPARRYLLRGLLRCGQCAAQAILVSRPRDNGDRAYVCATGPRYVGCGRTYALAEPLELFVTEAAFAALDSAALAAALHQRKPAATDEWQQRADNATARLDELAAAYAEQQITMREWLAARDPLQRQLEHARRRVAADQGGGAISEYVGRSEVVREAWKGWTLDRRQALLSSLIVHVLVGPGRRGYNRFDPSRFTIVWRH